MGVEIINLNDSSPAAPAGQQNVKWQRGSSSGTDPTYDVPIFPVSAYVPLPNLVIGFVLNDGAAGTNIGPMLAAPRAGSFTKCIAVTKGADGTTALTFKIKQNGMDIFSSDPTISAGTSSGTVSTFTSLTSSPLPVAANDVFSIDVTSGAADWQVSIQLE